jgi:hypothetical protein
MTTPYREPAADEPVRIVAWLRRLGKATLAMPGIGRPADVNVMLGKCALALADQIERKEHLR